MDKKLQKNAQILQIWTKTARILQIETKSHSNLHIGTKSHLDFAERDKSHLDFADWDKKLLIIFLVQCQRIMFSRHKLIGVINKPGSSKQLRDDCLYCTTLLKIFNHKKVHLIILPVNIYIYIFTMILNTGA